MPNRTDEFRRQVNELWKHAVAELDEVKEAVLRSRGRLELDWQKMRVERDRLLKKLGEQTYRLTKDGKLPVPELVKTTVDRLNKVIDGIVEQRRRQPAGTKGSRPRRKKTVKKVTRRAKPHAAATP